MSVCLFISPSTFWSLDSTSTILLPTSVYHITIQQGGRTAHGLASIKIYDSQCVHLSVCLDLKFDRAVGHLMGLVASKMVKFICPSTFWFLGYNLKTLLLVNFKFNRVVAHHLDCILSKLVTIGVSICVPMSSF